MVWRNDEGDYPPSDFDPTPRNYCGSQKLAEALLGRDLLGFNPNVTPASWANGDDRTFYPKTQPELDDSLTVRKKHYLELGTDMTFRLGDDSSGTGGPGLFKNPGMLSPDTYVLCDIFGVRRMKIGQGKTVVAGSPILYYKANTSSKIMDPQVTDWRQLIYNAQDNFFLLGLKKLTPNGDAGEPHKLADNSGQYFYSTSYKIIDQKIWIATGGTPGSETGGRKWPHRPDSYILISAGLDGEYGTSDDICNF